MAEGIAASYGATATVKYRRMFPPVINHERETELAVQVANLVAGPGYVQADMPAAAPNYGSLPLALAFAS